MTVRRTPIYLDPSDLFRARDRSPPLPIRSLTLRPLPLPFQEYVATRWYRAPEIMLTFKQYTKAIDVWSVGCILAEMLSGKPIFPGRDYHHQLTLILDVLGTPTLDEFYAINSRRSRDYIRALPFRKRKSFQALYPNASAQAVDFLQKTLTCEPFVPSCPRLPSSRCA
jgi:serine/threonine protein kinase